MPTSGRKPHSAYGDAGIMTLTIDGSINAENRGITNENDKQCSLKQNQNLILGRGSEEYILSLREGTLEASTVNWIIPQPWDREWSFQRGGVFSPTQCVIADCKVALISETIQRPVDGTAKASSWGDFSDNNFEFTAEAGTEPILEADSTKRFFNNVNGSTSLSLITNYASVGDNLNIAVNANNFAVVFFVKTDAITNQEQCLLSFGTGNTQGSFQVSIVNNSTLKIRSRGTGTLNTINSSSVLSTNSYYTIVIGTTDNSGTAFARVNGTDVGLSGTINSPTLAASGAMSQINLGIRENGGSYNRPFTSSLYEFYWLKSSTVDNSFLSEIKKIEGGLAQKYDTLSDLPADHTYKTEVPHGSPIKHAPNRFG